MTTKIITGGNSCGRQEQVRCLPGPPQIANCPRGRPRTECCSGSPHRMVEHMGDPDFVRLITLDPAHFHAALVQKQMLPGIAQRVSIYAPLGPDLLAHLKLIEQFNSRPDNPTSWELDIHCSPQVAGGDDRRAAGQCGGAGGPQSHQNRQDQSLARGGIERAVRQALDYPRRGLYRAGGCPVLGRPEGAGGLRYDDRAARNHHDPSARTGE